MVQILLHKQKLTKKQIDQLSSSGVIAIQTDDPAQFKLIDAEPPQFATGDLVWACITSIAETDSTSGNTRFVKKLAQLAQETRAKAQ